MGLYKSAHWKKIENNRYNKLDHNGASIHDQEEIANLFNEYFSEVGEKLSSEIPSTNIKYADYIKHNECTFDFVEIYENEVLAELKNRQPIRVLGQAIYPQNF